MVVLNKLSEVQDWAKYKLFLKECGQALGDEPCAFLVSKTEVTFTIDAKPWKGQLVLFGEKGAVLGRKLLKESVKFWEGTATKNEKKLRVAGIDAPLVKKGDMTLLKLATGWRAVAGDQEGGEAEDPQAAWLALKGELMPAVTAALKTDTPNKAKIAAQARTAVDFEKEERYGEAIQAFTAVRALLGPPAAQAGGRPKDVGVLDAVGFDGRKVVVKAGAEGVSVVPNDAAGAFPSYKVKVQAEGGARTAGLFKPVPDKVEGGFKVSPCFKKAGACEAREVFSSTWNELCGGLGDYPSTVPAEVSLDGGAESVGSIMAWRDGAKEFSSLVALDGWKQAALEGKDGIIQYLKENATGEMMIDGKKTTVDLAKFQQLIALIEKERDELPAKKAAALAKIDDDDAQSLMAFHIGTLQLDAENASNIMFSDTEDGGMHVIAIDGGLSAPDKISGDDLNPPCWMDWPHAEKPWTAKQKEKFAAIPPLAEVGGQVDARMGPLASKIEAEALHRTMVSTEILRWTATVGATPKDTFSFTQSYAESLATAAERALGDDKSVAAFAKAFEAQAKELLPRISQLPKWKGLAWDQLKL